ncbi:hypothetical protein J2Z48_002083 [Croceifilum oryzae]|uniref:DUF669 domain-containing protein n=1 Tax=Croceifilum oryzae TaxID=1553429 RepID=A0AAJ1TG52_9BACL|nr:DUF669 domain-containing protein [Croceifilum oryzae]MDQ0417899.1 hypothetical protein [Croceifilum oryzae]
MSQWSEYLSQFQKGYQEAEFDVYDDLPDGQYVMNVEAVRFKTSKTNRPMLEWELAVTEGPFKGRKEWKYHLLDDPDRIGWMKQDLFRAGLQLEDITKLESELPNLLDRKLQIKIQTKSGDNNVFRNLYFQKQLKPQSAETASPVKSDQKVPPWAENQSFPF